MKTYSEKKVVEATDVDVWEFITNCSHPDNRDLPQDLLVELARKLLTDECFSSTLLSFKSALKDCAGDWFPLED